MRIFEGKVAIISGATSGLGRAIAIEFAKKGANVSICGRREQEGLETLELLKKEGANGLFTQTDISKSEDVQNFVNRTVQAFGNINFAINNAAIGGASISIKDYSDEKWDKVIAINLRGTFLLTKYSLQVMEKNPDGGAIVNVSSLSGLVGYPLICPYSASKFGIIGLTKSASLEFAEKKIRINAICPGGIETEMTEKLFKATGNYSQARKQLEGEHPMNRLARPEEVAKAAVWLCSDEASFITGVALPVDGGYTAR
jgi:NAD(P)-dependent dehydrogenase (short-subunit alcohol dehydrogenase family)